MNEPVEMNIDFAPQSREYVIASGAQLLQDVFRHFVPEDQLAALSEDEIRSQISDELVAMISEALINAYNEGLRRAVGHMSAEFIERGLNITLNYKDADSGEAVNW